MSLKTEPVLTTTQVNNRLLELLRLFMSNYKDMSHYQKEIMFNAIQEVVKNPAPIETEYYQDKNN